MNITEILSYLINNLEIIIPIIISIIALGVSILNYYENRKVRMDTNSAHVVMYFENEGHLLYLIIENVGKTSAKNVNIEITPKLHNTHGEKFEEMHHFEFMPPNFKFKTGYDTTINMKKENENFGKFKFKIKFTNIYSQYCEEEYVYDLNYLNSKKWWGSDDSIKTSLSKINENLSKLKK